MGQDILDLCLLIEHGIIMQTESLRNVSILLLQKHFKASMLTSCPRKKTQTRT